MLFRATEVPNSYLTMNHLSTGFLRVASLPIFLLLITAFAAFAQGDCRITGTIKGLGNGPVTFLYTTDGKPVQDTVYAQNDRFFYTARPSDDGRIAVFIRRPRFFSVWYEPGTVTLTGHMSSPHNLTVGGTPENERLQAFNKRRSLREKQAFVEQNPDAFSSAYHLYWRLVEDPAGATTYETLFNGLTERVKQSPPGRMTAAKINGVKNQPVVGRAAPTFTLPDTAGRPVSLQSVRGRYVLLDFWGTWCAPCMKALPKLKSLHDQYAPKVAFIGIAAQTDRDSWLQTIREKALNWLHLSDLKGDRGPVITQYNVEAFPTYLLLDPSGTVLERTGSLAAMEEKLRAVAN